MDHVWHCIVSKPVTAIALTSKHQYTKHYIIMPRNLDVIARTLKTNAQNARPDTCKAKTKKYGLKDKAICEYLQYFDMAGRIIKDSIYRLLRIHTSVI